jgi:hypothetical protein
MGCNGFQPRSDHGYCDAFMTGHFHDSTMNSDRHSTVIRRSMGAAQRTPRVRPWDSCVIAVAGKAQLVGLLVDGENDLDARGLDNPPASA